MMHQFAIGEKRYDIWLLRDGDGYRLRDEQGSCRVGCREGTGGYVRLTLDGHSVDAMVASDGDDIYVHIAGQTYVARFIEPVARYSRHHGTAVADTALAPMPGVVIANHVVPGQTVSRGETLVVIESMKLETAVKAWRDGTVATVHVDQGRTFDRGAQLVSLAPEGDA